MYKEFPINVFPDVKRDAFNKYTKKNVTEDYIYENLQLKGWQCYKPFVDTGIDLIAVRKDKEGNNIYRYIQIKTRALVSKKFGYTFKPKDFRTDPRHYFLFFCDTVNDIILLSMYNYMKLFYINEQMGVTHFANPTFRTNNNKLNSLTFDNNRWTWSYRNEKGIETVDFEDFLNEKGLERMASTYIDKNLDALKRKTATMKFKMFYKINKTGTNSAIFENGLDSIIFDSMERMKSIDSKKYIDCINQVDANFKKNYPTLYESHKKYIYGCFENGGDSDAN